MPSADPRPPVRVLYAEDDPFDADLARAHFEANAPGISLDVVQTGEACLARLANGGYHALLLDHHLPDMDALEVLQRLAGRRSTVPVVVTTSVGDEALAVEVLQRGACDYIPKDGDYLARLPAVLQQAIAEHRGREAAPHGLERQERHVLYIEHDPTDVDLTVRHLAEVAPLLQLEVVSSASAALDRLTRSAFDLVLADLRLPEMNALDLLREAKARGLLVPFIVVTGGGDENAAVAALKLGAYDYIVKRADYLARLPHAIEHTITRWQLARANRDLQRELAERQRLQQATAEALALLDALQKHAPIGIGFLDREFRYQRVNDELARINGVPAALHIGRTIDDVVPDIAGQVGPLYRRALNGETVVNVEVTCGSRADPDKPRHLNASFYPVRGPDEEVLGVGLAVADITDRKQAEAALREHAVAVAEMARQKDQFLAMLSHELRNPLAPIFTGLELMRRKEVAEAISAHALDVIERQVTHMARLVDDLLDVARITNERVNLNLQTVDIRRIIHDALDSTHQLIAARHHRLETSLPHEPLLVHGDPTRLVQVLVNVLNNAAKYTNEGGTIRLSVSSEGGQAVVRVADTGVGIPKRLLPKIFDLFTQDERTLDRAQGGLGLGLTIVRRITELHGGSVEARSDGLGRGSDFTIRLPVSGADEVMRPEPAATAPARPLRCLVVEDNVDAAYLLELALTLEGHEVRLAFDGRDAVRAAQDFRPEIIVMDIGLPRMNGYEAARAIRELPGLADVHLIAVTGYGQEEDYEKSRRAGFDSHLVKPVEFDALLRIVAAGRARPDAA